MDEKQCKYRINPPCPICGEEHCSWTIMLTEEEQAEIDDNGFVIVERELVCGACKKPFTAPIPVIYWDEIGYNKSLSIEEILKIPPKGQEYLIMDESSAPIDNYEPSPEDEAFEKMIIKKYRLRDGMED